MRMLQSKGGLSKPDAEYWKAMGWTGNKQAVEVMEKIKIMHLYRQRNFIEK